MMNVGLRRLEGSPPGTPCRRRWMHPTSLERLARQLADGLRGDHDAFCRELVRLLASGHPVAREHLATVLQMTAEQVAEVLAGLADIELDPNGKVVRWGLA